MQIIQVGQTHPVRTITEALETTAPDSPLTLLLEPQVYHEKIFCSRGYTRLIGCDAKQTKILWQDAASYPHPDSQPTGTFRSHTALFAGDRLLLQKLTIKNAAPSGAGQAVAAALYTAQVCVKDCRFVSLQDTVFLGPLPEKERLKNGFLGPMQHAPRRRTQQVFMHCAISGDVDFIFGGGDALFWECNLHAAGERSGYLAAPSTTPDGLGFVFDHCWITADLPGQLRLARPWRAGARAIFLNCDYSDALAVQPFDPWQERADAFFFGCFPPLAHVPDFCAALTEPEAQTIRQRAREMAEAVQESVVQRGGQND